MFFKAGIVRECQGFIHKIAIFVSQIKVVIKWNRDIGLYHARKPDRRAIKDRNRQNRGLPHPLVQLW